MSTFYAMCITCEKTFTDEDVYLEHRAEHLWENLIAENKALTLELSELKKQVEAVEKAYKYADDKVYDVDVYKHHDHGWTIRFLDNDGKTVKIDTYFSLLCRADPIGCFVALAEKLPKESK